MSRLLRAQPPYDLRAVVFSHGWSDLGPFRVQAADGSIHVGLRSSSGPVVVKLNPVSNGVSVEAKEGKLTPDLIEDLRWMFRLSDPLEEFYAHARKEDRPWIEVARMGRLLRSQTVFEDLIKLILTTNCSWSLTRSMTDRLCALLGERAQDGTHLFPSPQAMAKKNETFFREKVRTGYRSSHLPTIARAVLSGKLNPEKWRDPSMLTEVVRKEILAIPGAGPYVADNLLRYLGRHDYLGLDSWARGKLKELWKMKSNPADKTIQSKYQKHGKYRGLVLWCDLTRDWFDSGKFENWIRTEPNSPSESALSPT